MEEGAQERPKCLRHTEVLMQPYSPTFTLSLSKISFLFHHPSYPSGLNLWIIALGKLSSKKFSSSTLPLLHPHHVLTPTLVYALLMCTAPSLHLHAVIQWHISTESLRDQTKYQVSLWCRHYWCSTQIHFVTVVHSFPRCHGCMAHTPHLPEDLSLPAKTVWRCLGVHMSLYPSPPPWVVHSQPVTDSRRTAAQGSCWRGE